MNVLMIEPGALPKQTEIQDNLAAMQQAVGGPIQAIYPFPEPVALICHEEGEIYDIIAGPFFLCGAPPDSENFTSLTPEQLAHYEEHFHRIELYLHKRE